MLLLLTVLNKKNPVEARFYAPSGPAPGAHPASVQWVPGLFPGDGSVALTVHPNLAPRLQKE
jgi:hypothetical protein